MKLSFSTRGWAELNWEELQDIALDQRFGGIEVYNLQAQPALLDRGGPFHRYNAAASARQLREKKLAIPCFDTSCDLSGEEDVLPALLELTDTARTMQVPYISACALRDREDLVRRRLEELLPAAE